MKTKATRSLEIPGFREDLGAGDRPGKNLKASSILKERRLILKIWHYTTLNVLESIFRDGKLKCDKIYLKGEIPCVWLSTNENWEETVRKGLQDLTTGKISFSLSRNDLLKHDISPIRIEINRYRGKIIPWGKHRKKIPDNISRGLERAAKEWGADPNEWWVSYKPIPIKDFILIEIWDGKQWTILATRKERG